MAEQHGVADSTEEGGTHERAHDGEEVRAARVGPGKDEAEGADDRRQQVDGRGELSALVTGVFCGSADPRRHPGPALTLTGHAGFATGD